MARHIKFGVDRLEEIPDTDAGNYRGRLTRYFILPDEFGSKLPARTKDSVVYDQAFDEYMATPLGSLEARQRLNRLLELPTC